MVPHTNNEKPQQGNIVLVEANTDVLSNQSDVSLTHIDFGDNLIFLEVELLCDFKAS